MADRKLGSISKSDLETISRELRRCLGLCTEGHEEAHMNAEPDEVKSVNTLWPTRPVLDSDPTRFCCPSAQAGWGRSTKLATRASTAQSPSRFAPSNSVSDSTGKPEPSPR